ncbi:BRCT domain-containing protein, partial [Corynebacterium alimapuense]
QLVEHYGTSTALKGENVCFTGSLVRGTRADMNELLSHIGATPLKGLTKKTTLLVVGVPNPAAWKEGSSASRKLEKATALHEQGLPIRVLSEEDFFALLEE